MSNDQKTLQFFDNVIYFEKNTLIQQHGKEEGSLPEKFFKDFLKDIYFTKLAISKFRQDGIITAMVGDADHLTLLDLSAMDSNHS